MLGHAKEAVKAGGAACFGLLTGAAMMYGRAAVDKVVKPVRPLANFSVGGTDGLKVTFQNQAAGDTGYWDFGDGSPLEPFAADKPAVEHVYPKPGSYTAKLIVHNFLMEENERSLPVEVAAGAAPGLMPKVAVTVTPVNPRSVAPATFKVSGVIENVERAFLDLGDKVEVRTEAGPFEQYVVIDKPGRFPIQLIGHTGKQAVKQSATVEVQEDKAGAISAVVRVFDVGRTTQADTWTDTIPVPAVKGAKGFEKVVAAKPGYALTAAKVGAVKGVKGLTATVAADKRSVKLTGEWEANTAEAMVPLTLSGERTTTRSGPPQEAAASFNGQSAVTVPLPPQPRGMAGLTRRVAIELRQAGADGRPVVVAKVDDLKQPWAQPTQGGQVIRAEVVGEQVRVSIGK
jgi:hypothetical protein